MCHIFLRRRLCNGTSKQKRIQKLILRFRNVLLVILIILIVVLYKIKINHEDAVLSKFNASARQFIFAKPLTTNKSIDRDYVKKMIDIFNSQESIMNLDIYGSVNKNTLIMVILVGKYSTGFKYLLTSLSQLKGISNVLIIFSHSHYDANVNALIKNIDFCRVIQLFFPNSIQLYPYEFPGYDKDDCPHRLDIKSAQTINCTGAYTPDIHGRYRNPSLSETKHHWWWTANKVFDNLTCTVNHKGIVMFLEHNYFFMDDFLYMALYMKNILNSLPQCEFISLGTNSFWDTDGNMYGVEVTYWDPTKHSGVLAFDYSVWNIIVSHYDQYCYIDDYSWSRSLYYISLNRGEGKFFKVIYSLLPRAFEITTDSFTVINDFEIIEKIYKIIDFGKRFVNELAPVYLEVYYNMILENEEYLVFDYAENNGGWNDPRDKTMCSDMTERKIKKILLEMKNEFKGYIP